MSNYYCLVAGLPDVAFDGSKSVYTVERFKEDIYPELSAQDAACVDLFFLERDNANILNILRNGEDADIKVIIKQLLRQLKNQKVLEIYQLRLQLLK